MKTAVASTSIQCYHAIRGEGRVSNQQAVILSAIREGRDYSLQELVRITGLQINTVSGRVNELKEMALLDVSETRKCSITGRTVHPVKLPLKQRELFQ